MHHQNAGIRAIEFLVTSTWCICRIGPVGEMVLTRYSQRELLRDACEDKKEMTGANDTSQLAEAEIQEKCRLPQLGPVSHTAQHGCGRSLLLSFSSSSRHLDKISWVSELSISSSAQRRRYRSSPWGMVVLQAGSRSRGSLPVFETPFGQH